MQKIILVLALATATTTCKLAEDMNAGNLSSFRRDDKGNVTVAVGIFMNKYPSVVDGEFFPFELYDEDVAKLEEGEFKGFAADVITAKHPFEGFQNPDAVEKAKAREARDPYHFGGYYLKIMVVNDDIEPLPTEVYLSRGFFPHNFYCPKGLESVKIKADDTALGNPQGDNVLGSPSWAARAARAVTFCKTKEVNGPYSGRSFYYTRVGLFAQDAHHINELNDQLGFDQTFANLDSQYHETISARVRFDYKGGGRTFTEGATIVNLNYNVTPAVLELHELLRQNSTDNPAAIISSTDKVQQYLHRNHKRAHDANWQVLLLAQRKWLAIRLILENMGRQQDDKAEQLRAGILTSLELADVRDMLPMTEKLAEYGSAADYLDALRRNPATTVNDAAAKELFFSATSHQHFNRLVYRTGIAAAAQQWFSSRQLYNWISSMHDFSNACTQFCPAQERAQVTEMVTKIQEQYDKLAPLSRQDVHDTWMTYVSAINKIYPSPHQAPAAFKKKYVGVVGNKLDFDNSSQAYKIAYQAYSRRYDLVFAEPHGLLMGTEVFIQQVEEKRKPDDVHIASHDGKLQYDWKMHPHVQFATIDTAIGEMLDGIYLQAKQLHNIAKKIHKHGPNASQQAKLTSDFAEHYQILPLAKALLVRPDYANLMNGVFSKYTRFRPVGFFNKWVLGAVTVAATVAGLVLSFSTLGASLALPAILPSTLYAIGAATGLLSSAAQYHHGRVVQQRAESSLFADNFGTNFEEYYRARQQYLQARRDLYITAAFTAFDAAEYVRAAYRLGHVKKQIASMTKALGSRAKADEYKDVFLKLKHCSSGYCRKFIQSIPMLTYKSEMIEDAAQLGKKFENLTGAQSTYDDADLTKILEKLKEPAKGKDFSKFQEAIKDLWIGKNTGGAFNKVIKAEFINDVVRSRFLPFTDLRITSGFIPPKLRGVSAVRQAAMVQLLDTNTLKSMHDAEKLELFGVLVNGRKYKKRFIFFDRGTDRRINLLSKKLGMSDKELRRLYVGRYKPNKTKHLPADHDHTLKGYIDATKGGNRQSRKEAKANVKDWLEKRRVALRTGVDEAGEEVTMEEAENFIDLFQNEERINTLRANFHGMVGKIAKFKRKAPLEGVTDAAGDAVTKPKLLARSVSRLPGVKNDVVEQVANSKKWQKIFGDNPGLKDELFGKLKADGTRVDSEIHNMLDKLNNLFEQTFVAYQKQAKNIPPQQALPTQ